MQIKYISFLVILMIFVSLICSSNCSSDFSKETFAQTQTNRNLKDLDLNFNSIKQEKAIPKYNILLGNKCIRKKKCYVYLVLEKKFFNKADLTNLVNHLKLMNKEREFLRVAIFDEVDVAKDYLNGRRESREIDNDIKGLYFFDLKEEILKAKLGNSSVYEIIFQNNFKEN